MIEVARAKSLKQHLQPTAAALPTDKTSMLKIKDFLEPLDAHQKNTTVPLELLGCQETKTKLTYARAALGDLPTQEHCRRRTSRRCIHTNQPSTDVHTQN